MEFFTYRPAPFKNKPNDRQIRNIVTLALLFLLIGTSTSCTFDCAKDGCCYSRGTDIVCKTYKSSNVFNVSTILFKTDVKVTALTYCDTFLCYLSADDNSNKCMSTNHIDEKNAVIIDLPSGATGLIRKGHTHFIDYPRVLYILQHKTTNNNYTLTKLSEDISFQSDANHFKIYEKKICKFINFKIFCTDGQTVDAADACPHLLETGSTFLSYLFLVVTMLLIIAAIAMSCYIYRRPMPYRSLSKSSQATGNDIKYTIEFSDIDLESTDAQEADAREDTVEIEMVKK